MKLQKALLILSSASLLLATACQDSHARKQSRAHEQRLRINIGQEPQSLDPRKARSLNDINLVRMFMDGLTRSGKEGKTTLALAESYNVSEDLTTYTFTLRDARWSNGDPVTAHDFVYTWKKTLSPDFGSDNAHQLYVIKNGQGVKSGNVPVSLLGVKALDDKTLVVKLENPTPYFLELLTHPAFFPVNPLTDRETPNWAQNGNTYVGNGPFQPKQWKHQDLIQATKNSSYWDAGSVRLNEIEMIMVSSNTALKLFENHELDWEGSPLSSVPIEALPHLKENKLIQSQPSLGTFILRTNVENPALSSAKARKALAMAINRQAIIDHVIQGGQTVATGFVPRQFQLKNEGYFADGDTVRALALFEEALEEGHASVNDFNKLVFLYAAGDFNKRVCEAIQDQWKSALGINIQLQAVEAKVYFDRVSRKDYDIASGSWIADFNDPVNFLNVFYSKETGTNNTNWENLDYMALLEKSNSCLDPQKRLEMLKTSEQILMSEMPVIPLYHYNMIYLKDNRLKDAVVSSLGTLDLKWAYLQPQRSKRK